MSHFSVIVVTDENPETNPEVLKAALQPFHEFECTGVIDEYVQDVDKTEEYRSEYETKTVRRFRSAEGGLHDPYSDRFYREFTDEELATVGNVAGTGTCHGMLYHSKDWGDGRGYRAKVHSCPEGFADVQVPVKDVMTFAEFIEDEGGYKTVLFGRSPATCNGGENKHGYVLLDKFGAVEKVIKRTNPNAKWDWWTIGGRYSSRFAAAYDPTKDPENFETCFLCHGSGMRNDAIGQAHRLQGTAFTCNGCGGKGQSLKADYKWRSIGNVARWGDVDVAGLKEKFVKQRRETVDEIQKKFEAEITGYDLQFGFDSYNAAANVWSGLPEPRPRGADYVEWMKTQPNGDVAMAYHKADVWRWIKQAEGQTIEEWVAAAPPVSCWAILKDGKWAEHGNMGWFGMSSDDKADWNEQLQAILDTIRPDQFVTMVDCHI